MMIRRRSIPSVLALGAALAAGLVGPASGEEAGPMSAARSIQVLQDQIAAGDRTALDRQRRLIEELGGALMTLDGPKRRQPQVLRAMAAFLLNGGSPALVRRLLRDKASVTDRTELLEALLAFAERRPEAGKLLAAVDIASLPASLRAHVALARAIAGEDAPEQALRDLAMARVLAPGSLVEESALRREIRLLLATGRLDDAARMAGRYLWRFSECVYAGEVIGHLEAPLLAHLGRSPAGLARLRSLLADVAPGRRGGVAVALARRAIASGQLGAVEVAASVVGEGGDGSGRHQLMPLVAIAEVFKGRKDGEPGLDAALAGLAAADAAALEAGDRDLLRRAQSLARQITSEVRVEAADDTAPSAVMVRARDAVAAADVALKEE
jgi:chemotaxis protein MotC